MNITTFLSFKERLASIENSLKSIKPGAIDQSSGKITISANSYFKDAVELDLNSTAAATLNSKFITTTNPESGNSNYALNTTTGYIGSNYYIKKGTVSTSANKQSSEYAENTSAILTSDGWLLINQGWHENTQISLATLIPDDGNYTNAATSHILSGYEAYSSDGKKLIGTIPTINKTVANYTNYYTTTDTGIGEISGNTYIDSNIYIKKGQGPTTFSSQIESDPNVNISISPDSGVNIITTLPSSASTSDYFNLGITSNATNCEFIPEITFADGDAGWYEKGYSKAFNSKTINTTCNFSLNSNDITDSEAKFYVYKSALSETTQPEAYTPTIESVSSDSNVSAFNLTNTKPASGKYIAIKSVGSDTAASYVASIPNGYILDIDINKTFKVNDSSTTYIKFDTVTANTGTPTITRSGDHLKVTPFISITPSTGTIDNLSTYGITTEEPNTEHLIFDPGANTTNLTVKAEYEFSVREGYIASVPETTIDNTAVFGASVQGGSNYYITKSTISKSGGDVTLSNQSLTPTSNTANITLAADTSADDSTENTTGVVIEFDFSATATRSKVNITNTAGITAAGDNSIASKDTPITAKSKYFVTNITAPSGKTLPVTNSGSVTISNTSSNTSNFEILDNMNESVLDPLFDAIELLEGALDNLDIQATNTTSLTEEILTNTTYINRIQQTIDSRYGEIYGN